MGPPGHFAIALAAKPFAPEVPLWVLLLSTEASDLLSYGFEFIGIEKFGTSHADIHQGVTIISPGSFPWSHGLFMSVVWSLVTAAIAFFFFRNRRAASVVGLMVFSHWVLDFIVHPPELPLLFNGSLRVGLGLWTSGPGLILSAILEFVLLGGGIAIYLIWRKRKTV
jgi:membrane-bound metal-dependent hydrolase YbcI (DUF457 family)